MATECPFCGCADEDQRTELPCATPQARKFYCENCSKIWVEVLGEVRKEVKRA